MGVRLFRLGGQKGKECQAGDLTVRIGIQPNQMLLAPVTYRPFHIIFCAVKSIGDDRKG